MVLIFNLLNLMHIKKMSKPKGYLEFNDVYYRDLIKINSYLLNGKKSFSLNKIVSLIDTLRGIFILIK